MYVYVGWGEETIYRIRTGRGDTSPYFIVVFCWVKHPLAWVWNLCSQTQSIHSREVSQFQWLTSNFNPKGIVIVITIIWWEIRRDMCKFTRLKEDHHHHNESRADGFWPQKYRSWRFCLERWGRKTSLRGHFNSRRYTHTASVACNPSFSISFYYKCHASTTLKRWMKELKIVLMEIQFLLSKPTQGWIWRFVQVARSAICFLREKSSRDQFYALFSINVSPQNEM